jgi:hypothetical protein
LDGREKLPGWGGKKMKRHFRVALVLAGCLTAASALAAQTATGGNATDQSQPVAPSVPAAPSSANPFPEDTSNVPVMPSKAAPGLSEGSYSGTEDAAPSRPGPSLPGEDLDPVRSPDDAAPSAASRPEEEGFSSSLKGLEKLLPAPGEDQPEKKKKLAIKNLVVKESTHQEASSKDIQIGGYYLDTKNWKAALSRFESAMVLDPENPEVYWGLAEAERHLGNFASARGYYQKVAEYDPDSRHGKEARKELQEPEIANGKNAAPGQPTPAGTPK